jgi:hypothetical protein
MTKRWALKFEEPGVSAGYPIEEATKVAIADRLERLAKLIRAGYYSGHTWSLDTEEKHAPR